MTLGREAISAMRVPAALLAGVSTNVFSEEFKLEAARIALLMAEADVDVLLAVVQREVVPFNDPKGERIPFLHPNGDEDGICPVCGAAVEYQGDRDTDYADGVTVSWYCSSCGTTGIAQYQDAFVQHDKVCDKDGRFVCGRV